MAIKFIYFDLGNVLLDFTHERGFEQIASVAGLNTDDVRKAIVDSGLSDQYDMGQLSTDEFHRAFCEATGTTATVTELTTAWGDIFEIKPQTIAIAANLVSTGHRIGILSNTCAAHWEYAAKRFRPLSLFFDPVITSYETKVMKPDAGIYKTATDAVGLAPEEIFFADDHQQNVEGASSVGKPFNSPAPFSWRTIWKAWVCVSTANCRNDKSADFSVDTD